MKLLCGNEYYDSLLEKLKDYQNLEITLIEKGMDYEGFGYLFSIENLEDLIRDLEQYKSSQKVLEGKIGERFYFVQVKDIYYIEGLSKESYFYTLDQEYQSRLKLYEIEEQLQDLSFVRISKSMMVNIKKIEYILPEPNMRYSLYLNNGIKVTLNRNYIKSFKDKMKMR